MFINNINPVLLSVGSLEIRYYGLVYAIGFLAGYFILRHSAKKGHLKLTEEQIDMYMAWFIIGSIIISRLFEVFIYNPSYYMTHLSETYKIWNGGLSFQGGIVGAILVTIIFARKYKIKFYDFADIVVLPATITLAIGKLANYTNSELYGKITNVPWCVVFQKVDAYCRHPVQIYEFLLYLAIFVTLLIYYLQTHKHKHQTNGRLFWMFIMLYSISRFIIAFLRDEPVYMGLNVGQWLSIVMILISILFLWRTKSKNI